MLFNNILGIPLFLVIFLTIPGQSLCNFLAQINLPSPWYTESVFPPLSVLVLGFWKQKILNKTVQRLCDNTFQIYSYFIVVSGGLVEADFSSLEGIVSLFKNTTPESAAAGWLHYLAFDFWAGTWIIRHSRKNEISHLVIILPLLCTFMLGPVGIMIYSLLFFGIRQFRKAK